MSQTALSKACLILCLIGILIAAEIFTLWPQLDLRVAAGFYDGNTFPVGLTAIGRFGRAVFFYLPTVILVGAFALALARRFGCWHGRAPNVRTLVFLTVTIALGPTLLVNVVLKDHSHRPRPIEVTEFGGPMTYRPWYRFDGACGRNCSFVSGEASASFWTVAPAMETPMPFTPYAVAAAVAFGAATGLLRMAFGGHFISDVVFAALFTLAVIFAVRLWLTGRKSPSVLARLSRISPGQANRGHSDEADVRDLVRAWAAAVRRRDIEVILQNHTADIVMFDVPPPFQSKGIEAYRRTWDLFLRWAGDPVVFDISEMTITAGPQVAFVVATMRCSGHGPGGEREGLDFRLTIGLRKIDGRWMIAHEHHSVPATD